MNSNIFVSIYRFFSSRKKTFYTLLILLTAALLYAASNLTLKEDLTAFIPKDEKAKKYQEAIKNLKANDRIVFNITLHDTTAVQPEQLTQYAEELAQILHQQLDSNWLKEIKYKIDEETAFDVFDLLYDELPYYLNAEDYQQLEQKLTDSALAQKLEANYNTLISGEGTAFKPFILKDPLGLNNFALTKLARLQSDENFELYDGYFLTKNKKHLFLYLSTAYPSNDSNKNIFLIDQLDKALAQLDSTGYTHIKAEYFGAPAIAVANVTQIKTDTLFTTLSALVIIFAVLWFSFRNLKTIVLIFLPVFFGGLFSLGILYLVAHEISAIAIGAGSIILGIALDYSLHFFTHLKHQRSVKSVITDLTIPLTLGCTTTVGAFLCLRFMQSEALQDMGLFAALSLMGAAFCCLVILPPLVRAEPVSAAHTERPSWIDRFSAYSFHKNKILLAAVAVLTLFFLFSPKKVGFETDMTKLSYITPSLEEAENNLDKITNYKLKSVFLVSSAGTLEEALVQSNAALPTISQLSQKKVIKKYSNVGDFLLTDSARQVKIREWQSFWTPDRIKTLEEKLYRIGETFRFKPAAFAPTIQLLQKKFDPTDRAGTLQLKDLFLQEYVNESDALISIITVLKVEQEDKEKVYQAFDTFDNIFVVDRGSMASMFAKIINEDFNFILSACAILVFSVLFLTYGRIELALLAFLPMFISWIWIIGIMGMAGLKFNIVNIIICTFIFGLGDDYSIFTIDGLEQQYKYGRSVLASYRNSIFLSAFTTMIGIGVLIFAKHPVLQSIALVTIIGIFCIVFVSLIIQPVLYDLLILRRKREGKGPLTIYSLLSLLLTALILLVLYPFVLITSSRHISPWWLKMLATWSVYNERKLGETLVTDFIQKALSSFVPKRLPSFETTYTQEKAAIEATRYYRGLLIKNYLYKGPVLEWYTRIKTGLEKNYHLFDTLLPRQGKIVDVGCGYGYLSYMLSLTAPARTITGIDYDDEKIEVAANGVLLSDKLRFVCSDVLEYAYENTDAFVISDVLHYLKEADQQRLIHTCVDKLNQGGVLILRDGNSAMKQRHQGTRLTEFFSTKVLGFNKVNLEKLCFTSEEKIFEMLKEKPVTIEVLDQTRFTSNIIFIIRKK
jgi:predicted exporter/2-polyprenyl-3-methyl-5-hydroxy-6-metoxy-1,4-benzoquinol methylase